MTHDEADMELDANNYWKKEMRAAESCNEDIACERNVSSHLTILMTSYAWQYEFEWEVNDDVDLTIQKSTIQTIALVAKPISMIAREPNKVRIA